MFYLFCFHSLIRFRHRKWHISILEMSVSLVHNINPPWKVWSWISEFKCDTTCFFTTVHMWCFGSVNHFTFAMTVCGNATSDFLWESSIFDKMTAFGSPGMTMGRTFSTQCQTLKICAWMIKRSNIRVAHWSTIWIILLQNQRQKDQKKCILVHLHKLCRSETTL